MDDLFVWIGSILAVFLIAGLLWLLARFILLIRLPGAVQCSMRQPGQNWRTGILVLGQDALQWYRTRSLAPVPRRTITRGSFVLVSHRPSREDPDTTIVEMRDGATHLVAAMSSGSFSGLVSWIDSAPPGIMRTGL